MAFMVKAMKYTPEVGESPTGKWRLECSCGDWVSEWMWEPGGDAEAARLRHMQEAHGQDTEEKAMEHTSEVTESPDQPDLRTWRCSCGEAGRNYALHRYAEAFRIGHMQEAHGQDTEKETEPDPELLAMFTILPILDGLENGARARVIRWIEERW